MKNPPNHNKLICPICGANKQSKIHKDQAAICQRKVDELYKERREAAK